MPELPDVEVFKRCLDARCLQQKVTRVQVPALSLLEGLTPQSLGRHLQGRRLRQTRRHGKFLFVRADAHGWLVLHFGMTGRLACGRWCGQAPHYTGALLRFEPGTYLAYVAPRKLGLIAWTATPASFIAAKRLGTDAAALSLAQLRKLAARRRGALKAWLMDQGAMAGIGNLYSDEILFQARLHPRTAVRDLDRHSTARLHRAIGRVLARAIAAQADPKRLPDTFLLRHRTVGDRCPRCAGPVRRIRAAGRTAYYCPRCQPAP